MTHKYLFRYLVLAFTFIAVMPLKAQEKQTLDKIIAVVGKNRIILESELYSQVEQMRQQNPELGEDLPCNLMEQMILQKMLVEQGERDSVVVSEEEVEGNLDNRIRYYIGLYGSKEKLEEVSGKTVFQLKDEYRDFIKETMMAERVQATIMQNVKVTPVEVQRFFAQIPTDSLPFFPAAVEIGQIVMDPEVSAELDEYAKNEITKIRDQIIKENKSFEVMAGLYSDDPGSRDNGGLIQGVTRSGFVPEFVSATFKLQNGEISPPVKTKFGYHIIQMVKRKGEEADVRHILIKPQQTSADFAKAMAKLDTIRTELVSGAISFEKAVGKYSTDEMSNRTGGMIADPQTGSTVLEIGKLDPSLVLMVDTMKKGSYSAPMLYVNERGEKSCRIVYMKNITKPHKANLEEDYSKIQAAAIQKKKSDKMSSWIEEKAPSYYIKVDPEYQSCTSISSWLSASK